MDEELPYADDIPYENQLPVPTEQAEAGSLKERIGNRIYLLEDSMSRKRKLVDEEGTGLTEEANEESGDADVTHADLPHRPNALLIQGSPISHLPTARVFAYATHFDAHPIGLEWVDDQTCVLVFANRKNALQAWDVLRKTPQADRPVTDQADPTATQIEDVIEETFCPALPLPLALYPIEERINSVLGNTKSAALKEPIQIRWARPGDVKKRGARIQSEFYKRHGETAGKEGLPGLRLGMHASSQHGIKRRKHNEDDGEMKRRLDNELDTFLEGDDQDASNDLSLRASNGHWGQSGRQDAQSQDHEEKRRRLDSELDAFLAYGDDPERLEESADVEVSETLPLLERTMQSRHSRQYKSLPRRGPRGENEKDRGHGVTAGDGRWLHNAEIGQSRRRDAYDKDGFGMRAWASNEPHRQQRGGRSKKLGKTQDELDQELDLFAREGI